MEFKVYMRCKAFDSATRVDVGIFLQRERLPELLVTNVAKPKIESKYCIVFLQEKSHADILIEKRTTLRFKGEPVYVSWYKDTSRKSRGTSSVAM